MLAGWLAALLVLQGLNGWLLHECQNLLRRACAVKATTIIVTVKVLCGKLLLDAEMDCHVDSVARHSLDTQMACCFAIDACFCMVAKCKKQRQHSGCLACFSEPDTSVCSCCVTLIQSHISMTDRQHRFSGAYKFYLTCSCSATCLPSFCVGNSIWAGTLGRFSTAAIRCNCLAEVLDKACCPVAPWSGLPAAPFCRLWSNSCKSGMLFGDLQLCIARCSWTNA